MTLHMLKTFFQRQKGFMLYELIASLAISGLIGLGASIASAQVMNQTASNNDYTTASRYTLNAMQWMSRDTQMAQSVNGTDGFPSTDNLSLLCTEWDNTEIEIIYSVEAGKLVRYYSVNGSLESETLIAENINPDAQMTNCTSDNGVITLTITGSVGAGSKITDVTKVREIACRPKL
jgi:type II secretory pathway component PulJ